MSFVRDTKTIFFVACQVLALLLLWVLVENNYMLTVVHAALWASLGFMDHLSAGIALTAFVCCIAYAFLAILVIKTDNCMDLSVANCVLSFIVKFVVSVICGLVNLSVYEMNSVGSVFRKTLMFTMGHAISISLQWAISDTSVYIVVLALAHVFMWAWYPNVTKATAIVCGAIVVQLLVSSDTFSNGSLLGTSLFCLAIDLWLMPASATRNENTIKA
tara:strand:+ start:150 stop:800 length:651 start_codon:yes stop_codon:yes gene_type:complete